MTTTNHTSPSGEDAANGAIGEREALLGELYYIAREKSKRDFLDIARAALTAEKVAAEPVAFRWKRRERDKWEYETRSTMTDAETVKVMQADGWFVEWLSVADDDKPAWNRYGTSKSGIEPEDYAAPQPAQTQVALTDDARECLADVVSHYRALYAGLAFQLNEATVTENADDMAYWKHEIKALERMYAQAERALLAAQPVSGGKS